MVLICQALSCHSLADGQLAGQNLLIGPVSHHHHIQQAEQVGQIGGAQIVLVGIWRLGVILLPRKRIIVLLDPCPDKAGIGDEEGVVIFTAVLVMTAVINKFVAPKVEVHAVHNIRALQYGIFPAV